MTEIEKHRDLRGRPSARRRLQAMMVALSVCSCSPSAFACTKSADGKCLPTTCSFGLATFGRLAVGMSPLEAARTLGCQGKVMESSNAYGTLFEIYRFETNVPGRGGLLDFHNSKLTDMVPIDLH